MALSEEEVEKIVRAGRIASRVKSEVKRLVRAGMKYIELASAV